MVRADNEFVDAPSSKAVDHYAVPPTGPTPLKHGYSGAVNCPGNEAFPQSNLRNVQLIFPTPFLGQRPSSQ